MKRLVKTPPFAQAVELPNGDLELVEISDRRLAGLPVAPPDAFCEAAEARCPGEGLQVFVIGSATPAMPYVEQAAE